MISYISAGGRLGENISFLYGVFRFCKINNIPYKDIVIDLNYTNVPFINTDKPEYVFKDNIEMFSNIKYIFKDLNKDFFKDFKILDFKCTTDIAQLNNFYHYNSIDKKTNIIFKDWWSLDRYWRVKDPLFDIELLNYICRPTNLVKRLKNKYKDIFVKKTVGIHVRRGDFLSIVDNKMLIDKNTINVFKSKKLYEVSEIEQILKDLIKQDYNIVFFSDDINWCKENFCVYKNVYFLQNKPYEDMILMSLCDNVIPNKGSFFSLVSYILCKGFKNV